MATSIEPRRVRYIKLGAGGCWEEECRKKGIIRFGFGSSNAERFPLCQAGQWAELTQSFIVDGKTKGTATRFTNETRLFFEDDGSTLWITFVGESLLLGFLDLARRIAMLTVTAFGDQLGDGWRSTDLLSPT